MSQEKSSPTPNKDPQPSQSAKRPRLRRDMLNEIPDLVSKILLDHLGKCQAQAKIHLDEACSRHFLHFPRERSERLQCLDDRLWHVTPEMQAKIDEISADDDSLFDPSLAALDAIVAQAKTRSNSKGNSSRMPRVRLRSIPTVPKYDAWIPVKTNYWVGKDLHVEPYMPFLGDQDDDCELAFEVYEDMADDAGQELDLSDGELDANGKFTVPKDDHERYTYYSMQMIRWREASRKATLAVVERFSKCDEAMWRVLGSALGVKETGRVKAIARVADERRREQEIAEAKRKSLEEMEQALEDEGRDPSDEGMPCEENWSASNNALRHFCFTCHLFDCPQHANVDVEPILPIEDARRTQRDELLKSGEQKPCSSDCFLTVSEAQLRSVDKVWSSDELLLLRESVPMFGLDPCSLAILIGSRRCFEVHLKLQDPIEEDIAHHEMQKATREQRVEVVKRKQRMQKGKSPKEKISAKSVVEDTDEPTTTDQDFLPCYHNGPCTMETCSCVKKGMHCESTCGCNSGRFQEDEETGVVTWTEPSMESIRSGKARVCANRHFGCSCTTGHCCTSACTCWDHNRGCNPDFCDCDCSILPSSISIHKRNCHNIPASIALHKKTYVGKSDIHGFGLFAGERFETGDLVGVYSGQLIDTRLADMIGRLYDATDRTYIFNVTESLVIDGGLLGSKAKFCNHTKPGARENCASKLVRVRGDAYVALFAKRSVDPGEEFLFDYRFTGEVPVWARDNQTRSIK